MHPVFNQEVPDKVIDHFQSLNGLRLNSPLLELVILHYQVLIFYLNGIY